MEHTTLQQNSAATINWRWWAAAVLFCFAFTGLLAGVALSERLDVVSSNMLTKAYYSLGLFVVGGLDVGMPVNGPVWARGLLWVAYFGSPLLTASAVIDAVIQVITPDRWHLRRIRDHIIVFGSGQLTLSYLRQQQRQHPGCKIVVVDMEFDPVREQELINKFGATTLIGDLTHGYFLQQLRLSKARKVLLLGDSDFQAFEAATRILELAPRLRQKLVLHCHNLRFMRSIQTTDLAKHCEIFNTYNLAATGFVKDSLIDHFQLTQSKDVVVMAGFGRFGQSILEELQTSAVDEISHVAVIDIDADRRILVAAEQDLIGNDYQRTVFEGDVGHPMVWDQLSRTIDLNSEQPTVILGTGQEQENLRTALWLKAKYPNARIFARTNDISRFALAVGAEHDITSISITQLMEDHIPARWLS